jgi:hypothetical protein
MAPFPFPAHQTAFTGVYAFTRVYVFTVVYVYGVYGDTGVYGLRVYGDTPVITNFFFFTLYGFTGFTVFTVLYGFTVTRPSLPILVAPAPLFCVETIARGAPKR